MSVSSVPGVSRRRALGLLGGAAALPAVLAACGGPAEPARAARRLQLTAIPDQDPEKLNRLYGLVSDRLADGTGLQVSYRPLTEYPAVVTAFTVGDVQLAWCGGLTGVQARKQVPGARAIVQRDVDADFHSVFIANRRAGLKPFTETAGLSALAGHSLTFGSETSTSGRLMPQYFMDQASLTLDELKGEPGFSGSHDKTIALVGAGTFDVGPVNELVWKSAVAGGEVDVSDLVVLWTSPGYPDYNWTVRPDLDEKLGAGTTQKLTDTLLGLDISKPADKAVLDLFEAKKFIPTDNAAYDQIETVAQRIGLLG